MVIWIAGTIIRLYAGKREFPWHLDQGDLLRERSIGVGVGVAFPDLGSYPGEPFHHGLLRVSGYRRRCLRYSLGCFLIGFQLGFAVFLVVVLGTVSLLVCCSVSLRRHGRERCVSSGVRCLQSRHGMDLSLKAALLVICRVEGLVFISEGKVLRFELVELLGALLQSLGMFAEPLLQVLDF
ncbi:hypothetical protein Bca4012_006113 [Brassica carinata]